MMNELARLTFIGASGSQQPFSQSSHFGTVIAGLLWQQRLFSLPLPLLLLLLMMIVAIICKGAARVSFRLRSVFLPPFRGADLSI